MLIQVSTRRVLASAISRSALLPLCAFVCVHTHGVFGAVITPGKLPAEVVEDVVVPVPIEVFTVLDKLSTPDWRALVRGSVQEHSMGRAQTALVLGAVIAEGFIAVQAQDAEEVKRIGRRVLSLAAAIGVRKSVVARSNSIIAGADARDWARVRRELDKALQDVHAAMRELHDEELAQLVSLGGWLRGTEAVTTVIGSNYSADTAELLRQPGLVDYFRKRLKGMNPRLREDPLLDKIALRLGELHSLVEVEDGRKITEPEVERIRGIATELVRLIMRKSA